MPVVNNNLSRWSQGFFCFHFQDFLCCGVPCGFVVGQQVNTVFFGQLCHDTGIIVIYGKRLLHHHMDSLWCADFHNFSMSLGGSECGNRFWLGCLNHFLQITVIKFGIEIVLFEIFCCYLSIRFGYSDNCHPFWIPSTEKPSGVSMLQSRDGHAKWFRLTVYRHA